jgi:hypothetical protein
MPKVLDFTLGELALTDAVPFVAGCKACRVTVRNDETVLDSLNPTMRIPIKDFQIRFQFNGEPVNLHRTDNSAAMIGERSGDDYLASEPGYESIHFWWLPGELCHVTFESRA